MKSNKEVREKIKNFIQDQQEHEVENESILEKIPNLVEYLLESTISQTRKETIEQYNSVRNKLVDMYRKRKGITIPNELAELALKLVASQTRQEAYKEIINIFKKSIIKKIKLANGNTSLVECTNDFLKDLSNK